MIDTLVAFGCSNTFGSEVFGPNDIRPESIYYAYPYYLSQKLNLPNYYNFAKYGASNFAISIKVLNYIFNNKDRHKNIFVVIGWSGDNRFTLVDRKNEEFTVYAPTINDNIEMLIDSQPDSKFINKKTFIEYVLSYYSLYCKYPKQRFFIPLLRDLFIYYFFNTHIIIFLNAMVKYNTVQLLQHFNISYITIPTILYYNHPLYELLPQHNNISCYDKNEKVIFEMAEKYSKYKEPNTTHINKHGHLKFAEEIYEYIQEYNTTKIF